MPLHPMQNGPQTPPRRPGRPGAPLARSKAGARRGEAISAELAEGLALRVASSLADSGGGEVARNAHGNYIAGFVGALGAVGILANERIDIVTHACHQILDGRARAVVTPEEALYQRAVTAARRQRSVEPSEIANELGVPVATGRALVDRMAEEGVVGVADMFGVRHLVAGGVA